MNTLPWLYVALMITALCALAGYVVGAWRGI